MKATTTATRKRGRRQRNQRAIPPRMMWGTGAFKRHVWYLDPHLDGAWRPLCGCVGYRLTEPDGMDDPPECLRCIATWRKWGEPAIEGARTVSFIGLDGQVDTTRFNYTGGRQNQRLPIVQDASVPPGEIQFRDGNGRVVARIVNFDVKGGTSDARNETEQGNASRQAPVGEQAEQASAASQPETLTEDQAMREMLRLNAETWPGMLPVTVYGIRIGYIDRFGLVNITRFGLGVAHEVEKEA